MGKIEYNSNNSGGRWWLDDAAWKRLEKAGWKVEWVKDTMKKLWLENGRWLGALARSASKDGFRSMKAGVAEWEEITKACATDVGCPCCGNPHNFTFEDDEGKKSYGPDVSYTASF